MTEKSKESKTANNSFSKQKLFYSLPMYMLMPLVADTVGQYFSGKDHNFDLGKDVALILIIITVVPQIPPFIVPFKEFFKLRLLWFVSAVPSLMAGFVLLCFVRKYVFAWSELLYYFATLAPAMFLLGIGFSWVFKSGSQQEQLNG